jgi:hypothetical protein
MFAPSRARTVTLRQNGALLGTFTVPQGVAITLQSDGALNRPAEAAKGLITTTGTGEVRFLRSPFTVVDSPAAISFRNAEVTISDQ